MFLTLCSNVHTCHRMLSWPKAQATYAPVAQHTQRVHNAARPHSFNTVGRAAFAWQATLDKHLPSSLPSSPSLAVCWTGTAMLQVPLGLVLPTVILARLELRDRYKFAQQRGVAYRVTLWQMLWSCMMQYGVMLLVVLVYSTMYCFIAG